MHPFSTPWNGNLIKKAYYQFNENSINNQDPYNQTENDETPGAEYLNENDSENTETNKTSAIPKFMPQILPDDELEKDISSLNSKQKEVFDVFHVRAKDYVKYYANEVQSVHILLSGSGRTGKSHLAKVI